MVGDFTSWKKSIQCKEESVCNMERVFSIRKWELISNIPDDTSEEFEHQSASIYIHSRTLKEVYGSSSGSVSESIPCSIEVWINNSLLHFHGKEQNHLVLEHYIWSIQFQNSLFGNMYIRYDVKFLLHHKVLTGQWQYNINFFSCIM